MTRIQTFGRYDLLERVGVGSMGEVFRARVREGGRIVALKRLMPFVGADPDVVEALHEEAELAKALDHPGIAKVIDVGEAQGLHYIAYEFVDGRDLRVLRERVAKQTGDGIPLDVAIHVVLQVASALAHAHARRGAAGQLLGLVHRDVCPSNILVAFDGTVKLADFGIAKAEGRSQRTAAGEVKGTVGYMSPEQARGEGVDGRSDVYALGVCLWELATGHRLFEPAPALVVMERIASGDVPSPRTKAPDMSEDLERVILKSLAHSPAQRYPGAEDFHAELSFVAERLGALANTTRVAQYVRNLFPDDAASAASRVGSDGDRGAAPWQERLNMADSKGGSDLDVFEGLAKKSSPQSVPPGLTPPPPATGPRLQRTLVGGLMAGAPGALPPPPSSAAPVALPPPSMPRPSTPPTSTPMPSSPSATPLPPPLSARSSALPQVPPPSGRTASGSLPSVSAPPPKSTGTPSGMGSLPPPTITPMRPPAALPPPSMPRPSTATPLPPPPRTLRPSDGGLPPPPATSLASALGVDSKKPASGKAAVDMDWDDDEASTHVYDKQTHDVSPKGVRPAAGTPLAPRVGAAAALVASSGGAAVAAKSAQAPLSTPLPTLPVPTAPPTLKPPPASKAPPSSRSEDVVRARPTPAPAAAGGGKAGVVLGAIALLAVIGLAIFTFIPRSGQFKIDIKSKSGAPIAKAEIFIDGQKKCDTAPCVVTDLTPGAKTIKVIAPDVPASEPITETVEAGKEKLVFITIDGASPALGATAGGSSASSTGGTGIRAQSAQPGIRVLLDGADKGVLPAELKDLSPGAHTLRFEGPRYEAQEQSVEVVAGQMKDLGPIKLKLLKGSLTLELATAGASVTLTGQGAKKEKRTLDSILKLNQPVKLSDIDATQTWKLVASKKGMQELVQEVSFADGQPEKSIRIELAEVGKPAPVAAAVPGPLPAAQPKQPAKEAEPKEAPKETKETPAAAAGSGTLNINSIPVSKVVLDGRPLGSTPKVGVSVPAGNHTVTFIHPELGKKSVTVAVKAGETKTAAVKFDKPAE